MELLKLLSANEIVAQILAFLILFFLLKLFVWKKILGLLDQRRERIAFEFKNIEESKADLEKIKSEYAAKLAEIEETAAKKLKEAAAQAKIISEQERKKAYIQAQEIIDNAKANIKYELSMAKEELKDQIIELTIKSTENLIREKFTEKDDRKIITDFLADMDKSLP
ncbi:MAG: F0F1 ATP synthase subunit B [Candidatus Omnitrophota bacterium]